MNKTEVLNIPQEIKDLDDVLKNVSETLLVNNGWKSVFDIASQLGFPDKRNGTDVAHILKKLKDDGYVIVHKDSELEAWSITHAGKVHLILDGYSGVYRKNYADSVLFLKTNQMGIQIRNLTYIMAFSTLITGIYAVLQIIDWFSTHYFCK